ncbi:hypothetical protein BDI4_530015 [Burkholderia diffusa]|nr:hypothetical protein BDI4_530015 [Burkholderia diffusa]
MGKPTIVLRPFDRHLTTARLAVGAFHESEILYCPIRANRHGKRLLHSALRRTTDHQGACAMYRKGSVLEIQFSPERLNDGAGDPYWIDLTLDEARRLYEQLAARFATDARANQPLDTFSLD